MGNVLALLDRAAWLVAVGVFYAAVLLLATGIVIGLSLVAVGYFDAVGFRMPGALALGDIEANFARGVEALDKRATLNGAFFAAVQVLFTFVVFHVWRLLVGRDRIIAAVRKNLSDELNAAGQSLDAVLADAEQTRARPDLATADLVGSQSIRDTLKNARTWCEALAAACARQTEYVAPLEISNNLENIALQAREAAIVLVRASAQVKLASYLRQIDSAKDALVRLSKVKIRLS